MLDYKRLLLATDLGEYSETVARKALQLAEKFNADLTLIHVVTPIPAYGYPGITDVEGSLIENAKQEMEKLAKQFNIPADHQKVEIGSIKSTVHDIADELGVDLVIVGSHEKHGLAKLLGSNASAIMQGAGRDVFVIRC